MATAGTSPLGFDMWLRELGYRRALNSDAAFPHPGVELHRSRAGRPGDGSPLFFRVDDVYCRFVDEELVPYADDRGEPINEASPIDLDTLDPEVAEAIECGIDPILFGMQTALPPGEIWIFSEMEHAQRAAQLAQLGPYQRAAGISVFGRLLPATGGTIIVNPHTPGRTLVLTGQWATAARAWANAIALETVLASDWSNDQVLEHVRAQPNLMLLAHQGQPAFTEGSGHKRGVAVFTSPDNLAEFGKIGGGPVERAVVDGQTLIDLVLQHDCDLITFNFVGPGGGREIHLDP